ncbi:hypothetical protein [Polaribacter sp. Q13]|uniref:hypothetical protein n=1 Tax=Polaribacter sp. Q13 TaxID=2806551 RepID=UPI00193C5949|nr:hypothetical protein [Polaribacter sp. Q13]QVY67213.1 hypothetical protein JOP69_08075 [Polaribacter sp. Q13]
MKNFITKTFLISSLIIGVNLIFYTLLSLGNWITPIETKKASFFNNTIEKPIYVIAGSSMGNSFDSELVSKKLNREVFNTSFTLSHKSNFVLCYITDKVKKGDIVIYGPEYDNYYDQDNSISTAQLASIYNNSSLFKYQSFQQKIKFIYNIPKMNTLLSYRKLKSFLKPNLYNDLKKYNSRGDYINQKNEKRTWTASQVSRYEKYNYNHKISEEFKKNILYAKKEVEKKGAYFFITFPPIAASEYDDRFYTDIIKFYKKTDLKLIGTPKTFVINDSLILNHPYHTTYSGTKKRSLIFTEKLKPIILQLKN